MKKILGVHSAPEQHWVGDGFPVRSLFSYHRFGEQLSPFLLFDYAGPMHFQSAERPRGVGEHPHRGFETVTLVYQGEVSHRDSTGAGGTIGPGDVQWMTAAEGILHDEFHSANFSRSGGTLEMVQLWVNLPSRDKMSAPKYQTLLNQNIPVATLPDGGGTVRVISGEYSGHHGPAQTFTPVDLWDVTIHQGHDMGFTLPEDRTLGIVVLAGDITVNGEASVGEAQVAILGRDQQSVSLKANTDSVLLVLSGEPIDEPIVGYGPFVMNDEAGIRQAVKDFSDGRFGRLTASTTRS